MMKGYRRVQAKNHLNYLIRNKRFKHLKGGGRVVTAQATTTKRSQMCVESQMRWFALIESVNEQLHAANLPAPAYSEVEAHFWLNLDETSVMCNAGNLRIIGAAERGKHKKNIDDSRDSITIICIGSVAGTEGPQIYLAKGKTDVPKSLRNIKKKSYSAPPGSVVVMTPNGYLTDVTWNQLAPIIAAGIRNMPVIKDHPDWIVVLSLDGFGSHLQPEALQVFAKAKIQVIKEEGDSSHVNQADNQFVAKSDK
jgi:hypothetical protein